MPEASAGKRSFNSIAAKIAIVHFTFLGLLAALVVMTAVSIGDQEEKQLVLSIAERQSMLSQRMTQQLLGFAAKANGGEDPKFQRAAANSSIQMFEKTQHALIEGGLVRLDLHMLDLGEIPPASPAMKKQQGRVDSVYMAFRAQGRIILDGDDDERMEAAQYLMSHNSELLQELDATATLLKADLQGQTSRVRTIQTVALLIGIILTLALLFVARKWLILPLAELSRASNAMSLGEIANPIDVDGPDEIRELGSSFERLRVAMKNFLATPESETSL